MAYRIFHRKWKSKKAMWITMVAELVGIIPLLVLFGLAQPDLYRTTFWQIGYDNGWNSDPNMILYAYANHRPLPTIPFVWSQTLTSFNVAISVLSLFVLLIKMIGFIMDVWYPIVGGFFSFSMMALYATSIYGQAGPDYADPQQPSHVAWYIARSCAPAVPYGAQGSCAMAKGTFGATCYMAAVYLAGLGLAVWTMLPNKAGTEEDEEDDYVFTPRKKAAKDYEMEPATPRSPRGGPFTPSPFTPRTQAFHTLDRKLPLRSP